MGNFIYKTLLIVLTQALLMGTVSSQESMKSAGKVESPHEFSISGTVGMSKLYLTKAYANGRQNSPMGLGLGLGYKYYFSDRWSIATGIELSTYKADIKIFNFSDSYGENSPEGDPLTFSYKLDRYQEEASATYMKLPITINYQTGGDYVSFYVGAGVKIGAPMSKSSKSKEATFIAATTPYGTIPMPGDYETYIRDGHLDNFDLKSSFMLTAEAGLHWTLSYKTGLYTGIYGEYGLNDTNNPASQRFIRYNPGVDNSFRHYSLLASKISNSENEVPFSEKIIPLSVGVKVGISFSLGGNRAFKKSETKKGVKRRYMDAPKPTDFGNMSLEEIHKLVEEKRNKTQKGVRVLDEIRDRINLPKTKKDTDMTNDGSDINVMPSSVEENL